MPFDTFFIKKKPLWLSKNKNTVLSIRLEFAFKNISTQIKLENGKIEAKQKKKTKNVYREYRPFRFKNITFDDNLKRIDKLQMKDKR